MKSLHLHQPPALDEDKFVWFFNCSWGPHKISPSATNNPRAALWTQPALIAVLPDRHAFRSTYSFAPSESLSPGVFTDLQFEDEGPSRPTSLQEVGRTVALLCSVASDPQLVTCSLFSSTFISSAPHCLYLAVKVNKATLLTLCQITECMFVFVCHGSPLGAPESPGKVIILSLMVFQTVYSKGMFYGFGTNA